MKLIWEISDIKGGLIVKNSNSYEKFIIAYDAEQELSSKFAIVSLSDGSIIIKLKSAQEITDILNKGEYIHHRSKYIHL
jgi:hypothetical protein